MTKKEILDYFSDLNFAYNNAMSHDNLSGMLDELIGEDRQEIVQCKDCKHSCGRGRGVYCQFIYCGKTGAFHKEDWFCAYGERRDA